MFSKTSNKTLSIAFGILLIVAVLILSSDLGNNTRTFRDELVDIDTSEVSEILLYPKSQMGKEVRLFKENDLWKVKLNNSKVVSVPKEKIKKLFAQLAIIKPKRLAGRGDARFAQYQVDSSATRVKIIEDGDITLDIILGRFSFTQPRTMLTYVRLADEQEIYEVYGILDMTFNKDENSFRNEIVINSDKNTWDKLVFKYSADSSSTIKKVKNNWVTENISLDSDKVEQFLNPLSRLTSSSFRDDLEKESLTDSVMQLTITTNNGDVIVIKGHKLNNKLIISSSQNDEGLFDGEQNGLKQKIFKGIKALQ